METPKPPPLDPESEKRDPELKALYDKIRREFTAADLQKYTEIDEETVPAEQVLAELAELHLQLTGERIDISR